MVQSADGSSHRVKKANSISGNSLRIGPTEILYDLLWIHSGQVHDPLPAPRCLPVYSQWSDGTLQQYVLRHSFVPRVLLLRSKTTTRDSETHV